MKGTAILYQSEQTITFLENVDHSVFEEIQQQCGEDSCSCHLGNRVVEFGQISPAFWHEDDIDWDYGY